MRCSTRRNRNNVVTRGTRTRRRRITDRQVRRWGGAGHRPLRRQEGRPRHLRQARIRTTDDLFCFMVCILWLCFRTYTHVVRWVMQSRRCTTSLRRSTKNLIFRRGISLLSRTRPRMGGGVGSCWTIRGGRLGDTCSQATLCVCSERGGRCMCFCSFFFFTCLLLIMIICACFRCFFSYPSIYRIYHTDFHVLLSIPLFPLPLPPSVFYLLRV